MTLTKEQRHAIGMGEPVTVEIDGAPCVVIRKDVYEKSRKIIDFSEMPPVECLRRHRSGLGRLSGS
jgi:hypothetical protein